MEFDNPDQICLRGQLILADPSLRDPNFSRSVLLLTEHSSDMGAHGYILNKPMGKRVGELLSANEFEGLDDVPVFLGGPVKPEQLTFASLAWDEVAQELEFNTHLSSEQAVERAGAGEIVRAFVGYSGWGEGQLESELKQRSWITRKTARDALEGEKAGGMWAQILCSMGPWYRLLAATPDDPALN